MLPHLQSQTLLSLLDLCTCFSGSIILLPFTSFFFGQALNSGVNSSGPAAFQPELGALSEPASIIDSGANSSQSASEYHSVMLSSSGRGQGSWLPILHSQP